MTTAGTRRIRARGGAVRWTRVAVIALFAALVVLVHHETAAVSAPAHATAMSGMPGMGHAPATATPLDATGHGSAAWPAAPVADSDVGPCPGMAMQHCATAGVDVVKIAPPAELRVGVGRDTRAAPAGRDVPGTVSRAPPDLSVLSRLLL
ncbi:hypothetical protein ACH4S9_21185 [Streptomyces sp. NPDC021225]|uniref:hypothetical protein n=1 Tax=Streptomyces sp. NPDC021225 TaxID=3365121 RepID=UPI0037A91808